jgi:hypothetical protein
MKDLKHYSTDKMGVRDFLLAVFLRAFSFTLSFAVVLKIFSFHRVLEVIALNILILYHLGEFFQDM